MSDKKTYIKESSKSYVRPVIPVLISIILGITAGSLFYGGKRLAYLAIIFCFVSILISILKKKKAFIPPVILFFSLGYISILHYITPEMPQNHISRFVDQGKYRIVGTIDRKTIKNKRLRLVISAENLKKKDSPFPATGKIRLTVGGKLPPLKKGDRISFYSKIRSIRNFKNPGGFDYKRFMAFQEIWGTSYSKGEQIAVLAKIKKKKFSIPIEKIRCKISDHIETFCPVEQRGLLKALVVGKKNEIPPFIREGFNKAGVSHILAISGLHIGIVATGAFLFFSWLLSFSTHVLLNAWVKKGAALLSLIPVITYGLISGMSPSSQRAVIMISVFLIAFLFEREHDPINTLSVAALFILIFDPTSLFSISFQLSFTAVFSIIYGISIINKRQNSKKRSVKTEYPGKLSKKILSFFMVSILAIAGTTPLIMFYFNQISTVGIVANLFVIPIIGFLVVPLGLASIFLYPISTSAAALCIFLAGNILKPAMAIVLFFAKIPFACVKTITPSLLEISCYYILGWVIFRLFTRINNKEKIDKITSYTLILLVFILLADIFYWVDKRFWNDNLRITAIDVGQGTASLIEFPRGHTALIDGGGFSDNTIFDMGAMVVAPILWRKKIRTVETLILSHPNSDHLNGLLYIAQNFNVKRIWTNGEPVETLGYKNLVAIIKSREILNPMYQTMNKTEHIDNAEIKILYPPADFMSNNEKWRNTNNNSMVIKIIFGTVSFLFPGDIEKAAEKELVAMVGADLKSTVLFSPHHGSRTSSTIVFMEKVNPEIVIISSGFHSRFNFPHKSVLNRYNLLGCRFYNTAKDGAVTIRTNGKSLTIDSYGVKD